MANESAKEQMELQFDTAQEKPQEKPVEEQKKAKEELSIDNVPTEINNMELMDGVNQSAFQSLSAFKDAYTIGKYLAMSDLVPQTYKGNPANCAIAVDISNRMGVSPLYVMQNLTVVRGVPSWSGQSCLSIIRGCGRYANVRIVYSGEIGKENRACWIEAVEKTSGEKIVGTKIDWPLIKGEGWDKNPKWKTMTEQMLAYRAAAFFARLYCSNELGGYRVEGEEEDMRAASQKPERESVDMFGKGLA